MVFCFKQKTAYEMRISDWSSDVCSSDLMRVYGIGQPSSVEASDTFFSFLSFVNAYDASPVDKNGKLLINDPKVKAGKVNALKDYTSTLPKGCTPLGRSEERRVGPECVSTRRSRVTAVQEKKKVYTKRVVQREK